MQSDIVERLREGSWGIDAATDDECMHKMNDLCSEASARLTTLEAENAKLRADCDSLIETVKRVTNAHAAAYAKGREDERERCAGIAAAHFIPGHSVAGPAFAALGAAKIRSGE